MWQCRKFGNGTSRLRIFLQPPQDLLRLLPKSLCNCRAVLSDILTPKGSGFVASHADDFLMANNGQWIGFSMEIGPEGGLYVLDWHDADICGKEVLNKVSLDIY